MNGYVAPQKDTKALIEEVEKFMRLKNKERRQMGFAGREKVEKEFDRESVVETYYTELTEMGS